MFISNTGISKRGISAPRFVLFRVSRTFASHPYERYNQQSIRDAVEGKKSWIFYGAFSGQTGLAARAAQATPMDFTITCGQKAATKWFACALIATTTSA